jgi:proteasome lid subunit RPN8/RPN11
MFSYNPNIYIANFKQQPIDDAIKHAYEEFPRESCGAIIDGSYVKFKNMSDNPLEAFEIQDEDFFLAYMNGSVDCIVHSHNDFNQASLVDQVQQRELDIPSLIINLRNRSLMDCIVFGSNHDANLIGRPFFYGAFDCISMVDDYIFDIFNVHIPHPPHEWAFWMKNKSFFEPAMDETIPFEEVPLTEIKKNDILLYNIDGTKYINHIAVMMSDTYEVYHHMFGTTSGSYPITFVRKYLRTVMRFNGEL